MESKPRGDGRETGDGFADFFFGTIRPALALVHRARDRADRNAVLLALVPFAAGMIFFAASPELLPKSGGAGALFAMILFSGSIAGLAWHLARTRLRRSAVRTFQNAVIRPIAAFVEPGLVYSPDRQVAPGDFVGSLLFDRVTEGEDRLSGSGYFSGGAPEAGFAFASVHAERTVRHGCHLEQGGLFTGIFATAHAPARQGGYAVALPRAYGVDIGVIGERAEGLGLEKPKPAATGVAEFDRLFVAYADAGGDVAAFSGAAAFWLLSLREEWEGLAFMSRVGNAWHVALVTGREHFRMPEAGEPFDEARCRTHCLELARGVRLAKGLLELAAAGVSAGTARRR